MHQLSFPLLHHLFLLNCLSFTPPVVVRSKGLNAYALQLHMKRPLCTLLFLACRDPTEEEMQLGDKIAALQQRVEQGEADQPESTPKPAPAKEDADSAESPEVAPRDSEDGAPAPVSYAAAAKPIGEEEEETPVTVQQALDQLEAQLAKLTFELDDKVRFSKGTGERESRWK